MPVTYGVIPGEVKYDDHHLFETVGYVVEINVEQEGPRQALHFMLRIYWGVELLRTRDQKCKVFLDVNTTTAMAQLQLLRDAMWSGRLGIPYLAHVWFNFSDESEEWAYVHWLSIILTESERVSVRDFRGADTGTSGWYYHEGREVHVARCFLVLMLLAACPGPEKPHDETGETAETGTVSLCPSSLEELCEREFGGPCPTFEEAAAYQCDGVHFSNTGDGEPNVDEDGNETCPNPTVSCYVPEDNGGPFTRLWFHSDMSGRLEGVTLDWPDTDECPGYRQFGDLWC